MTGEEDHSIPMYVAGEEEGDVILFSPDCVHVGAHLPYKGEDHLRPLPEENALVSVDYSFVLRGDIQKSINDAYFTRENLLSLQKEAAGSERFLQRSLEIASPRGLRAPWACYSFIQWCVK